MEEHHQASSSVTMIVNEEMKPETIIHLTPRVEAEATIRAADQERYKRFFKYIGLVLWSGTPVSILLLLMMVERFTPLFVQVILSTLVIGYTIWVMRWFWRYYCVNRREEDCPKRLRVVDVFLSGAMLIVSKIVTAILAMFLVLLSFDGEIPTDTATLQPMVNGISPLYLTLFIIGVTVVAPFLEELTYRGLYKAFFFRESRRWVPLVVSSAIFSLMHGSWIHVIVFLIYFVMGAFFYYAYHRQHNIYEAMLLHGLNNGYACAVMLWALLMR